MLALCECRLIAAGLSPFAPEVAAVSTARIMLDTLTNLESRGENFAFETTLSGLTYIRRIRQWREAGYHVTMFFYRYLTYKMNQKNIALANDRDLVNSLSAIRRAAKRAAQVAINTDTELIIARNGQNIRVKPNKVQPS